MVEGKYFEDSIADGAIKQDGPWNHQAGKMTYWSNSISAPAANPFTIVSDVTYDGTGKALRFSSEGGSKADVWYGGYYLDCFFEGLTDGKEYVISFYAKAENWVGTGFGLIYEANYYSNNNPGYDLNIGSMTNGLSSEWVKFSYVFHAANKGGNYTCLRFGFEPGTENGGSGAIYIDCIEVAEKAEVEKSPFVEDNEIAVNGKYPWEVAEGYEGGLLSWDQSSGMNAQIVASEVEGEGNYVVVDATKASSGTGNFNLDIYAKDLTIGGTYTLTFRYKTTEDFNLSVNVFNDANFDGDATIFDAVKLENSTDWKEITITFTTGNPTKNLHAIRFEFHTKNSGVAGAGTFTIDAIEIKEVGAE